MKKEEKIVLLRSYLDEILPNAKCELNYSKDYELLIAVMLSAQTTDKKVNKVTEILFSSYPSLIDLSKAKYENVYEIIKPLGLASSKAKNVILISQRLIDEFDGIVPNDIDKLMSLNGVGRKTASVVVGELFLEEVIPVDTHVSRVSKRLKLVKETDEPDEIEIKLEKMIKERRILFHHQMIHFGRYYCLSKSPHCENCKLQEICSYFKLVVSMK